MQIVGKDFETFLAMEFKIPSAERAVHLLPGDDRDSRAVGCQCARGLLQGPGRGRVHGGHRGRDLRPRFAFGGHTLFVKDGKLVYAYNFLGIPPEASRRRRRRGARTSSAWSSPRNTWASTGRRTVRLKLYVDDEVVGRMTIRTVTGHFALCGEGLCIGYDSGDAVSKEYAGGRFRSPAADRQGRLRRRRRRLRRRGGAAGGGDGSRLLRRGPALVVPIEERPEPRSRRQRPQPTPAPVSSTSSQNGHGAASGGIVRQHHERQEHRQGQQPRPGRLPTSS